MIAIIVVASQQAAWAEPPTFRVAPPWDNFLANGDRVMIGTVSDVQVTPSGRGVITEITVDVLEVLAGPVTSRVTVMHTYDSTSTATDHLWVAPTGGDAILFVAAPWLVDPARLVLMHYVRSVSTANDGLKSANAFGDLVQAVDCGSGVSRVDDSALGIQPDADRSIWEGPDPRFGPARERAALDWTTTLEATRSCLADAIATRRE